VYAEYKKTKSDLFKNIIGGPGLSIISISLIGSQLHAYHPKPLFTSGNILFIGIFLPLHIFALKGKTEEKHRMFQILFLAYILFLFTYGIFLKRDVS
jgi:Ca2+/Na+ antiporter